MSERDGCEQVKNPSYILGGWGPRAVGGAVGLQRLTGSWQPTCFFCRRLCFIMFFPSDFMPVQFLIWQLDLNEKLTQ